MIPLNVTHTAILNHAIYKRLLSPVTPTTTFDDLPAASTKLRYMLSTLVTYFADAYKSTFGFMDGPPLHDALTIAYVAHPELFKVRRYRVDIELTGALTVGETVVDMYNYRSCDDTWGSSGKNCLVAEALDVPGFFEIFLDCVARCDLVSPLNK